MSATDWPSTARNMLIGMVHAMPLPGSPRWGGSMRDVLDRALRDAATLAEAGFDALMIENFGDAPFYPDRVPTETVAGLTVVAERVAREVSLPIGVNVLRNDAQTALGIAAAAGASFIRVNLHAGALLTDQGWLTGRAHETLRLRSQLRIEVAICADVLVKHAVIPHGADPAAIARDTHQRGGADVLIVSGAATGAPADPERGRTIKQAVPGAPLWIGSGVRPDNVRALLDIADGAIVGSFTKFDGQVSAAVDPARAATLVRAAKGR